MNKPTFNAESLAPYTVLVTGEELHRWAMALAGATGCMGGVNASFAARGGALDVLTDEVAHLEEIRAEITDKMSKAMGIKS